MSTYEIPVEPEVGPVWVEYGHGTVEWRCMASGWTRSTWPDGVVQPWRVVLDGAVKVHTHDPRLDDIPPGPWTVDGRVIRDSETVRVTNVCGSDGYSMDVKVAKFIVETVNAALAQPDSSPTEDWFDLTAERDRYRKALRRIRDAEFAPGSAAVARKALADEPRGD